MIRHGTMEEPQLLLGSQPCGGLDHHFGGGGIGGGASGCPKFGFSLGISAVGFLESPQPCKAISPNPRASIKLQGRHEYF